jgi:hypothetical protein
MSRNPFASSMNETESAISDDELDGVVGGDVTPTPCSVHSGHNIPHQYEDANGIWQSCTGDISTASASMSASISLGPARGSSRGSARSNG